MALCAVSLLSVFASSANAGSYNVRECWPPYEDASHGGVPDLLFSNPQGVYLGGNDCPEGNNGGVQLGSQAITYSIPASATWTFAAPAGAFFSGATFKGKLTNGNGHIPAISFYAQNGAFAGGYSSVPSDGFVLQSSGQDFSGVAASPIGSVVASLACIPNCVYAGASPSTGIRRLEFNVNDTTPPAQPILSGDLVAGGVRHGTETLTIDASDLGGGVRYATVSVNGGQIARADSDCAFPNGSSIATQLRPCPNSHFDIPLNTEDGGWRNGSNTLEVCAFDVAQAGQAQNTCVQRSIEIDNSCEKSGGMQADQLSAGLKEDGNLADSVQVKSTDGIPLEGVVSAGGSPVQGANVCLFEQVDSPGDPRELIAVLKSRSAGEFSAQLSPGPSRRLDVVYRYNNKTLEKNKLAVRSQVVPELKPRKRYLRNGRSVKFKGTIPGPHNSDRQIAMQARVGKRWKTFKNVKTTAGGVFKAKYRFRTTHGRVVYKFRALVKPQAGYPYESGASKPKKIVVTG